MHADSGPPTGTVTCLFSDIEGSTRIELALGTGPYREVLERHRTLLRDAFRSHDGYEQSTEGDSFFVLFPRAIDAVSAAVDGKGAVHSSTLAREHLQAGNPQAAAAILGRAWEIAGRVEHGQKLGRKLGFPTANITLGDYLLPKLGIYAVRAAVDETDHPTWIDGVASLGYRPTVGGEEIQFEVYLFDYSGDLYGRHLRVALLEFLRPELKFPGLDELKAQIAADCEQARQFLAHYQGPTPGPLGRGNFVL